MPMFAAARLLLLAVGFVRAASLNSATQVHPPETAPDIRVGISWIFRPGMAAPAPAIGAAATPFIAALADGESRLHTAVSAGAWSEAETGLKRFFGEGERGHPIDASNGNSGASTGGDGGANHGGGETLHVTHGFSEPSGYLDAARAVAGPGAGLLSALASRELMGEGVAWSFEFEAAGAAEHVGVRVGLDGHAREPRRRPARKRSRFPSIDPGRLLPLSEALDRARERGLVPDAVIIDREPLDGRVVYRLAVAGGRRLELDAETGEVLEDFP